MKHLLCLFSFPLYNEMTYKASFSPLNTVSPFRVEQCQGKQISHIDFFLLHVLRLSSHPTALWLSYYHLIGKKASLVDGKPFAPLCFSHCLHGAFHCAKPQWETTNGQVSAVCGAVANTELAAGFHLTIL